MQGLGHEVPYGYDERMGVDRYQLMHDFFDRYLRVDDKLPPVVLVVSPRDNMEEVPRDAEIVIDFAPVIDTGSIISEKGIRILQMKNKNEVEGEWKVSHGGTRYTFTPLQDLNKKEQYSIDITTKVKDRRGIHLEKKKSINFTVASR
jgi:hypothetical protein